MRSSASDSSHRPSPGPASTAPPSPTRCSRLAASLYVAIEQIQNRRLGRCHREVPPASPLSRPPRAAARIAPTACQHPRHPPISLPALRRPQGPCWQESHRMHPFFAECTKKAPLLATSARNACFSRSRWQHPRPMHPFPGAIGRFGIHGARILPPRALFRVEEPEITHGAKMLPAPPGLSAAAACGPAERALRHASATCGTRHGRTGFAPCGAGLACLPHAPLPVISLAPAAVCAPCHLARVHRRRLTRVVLRRPHRAHRAQPSAAPPIAVGVSVDQALPAALVLPTPTHRAHRSGTGTARAPARANWAPALSQPSPAHPWSRLRPPAPRHPPRLTLPRGSRCGSGNSREMVR